jgi:hypothetical protein
LQNAFGHALGDYFSDDASNRMRRQVQGARCEFDRDSPGFTNPSGKYVTL